MPSYMKSTLSQMAMLSLLRMLVFGGYSVITGADISLPDRMVATISSIITLYVKWRTDTKTNETIVDSKPIVDDLYAEKLGAYDTSNK